jgi:serpin B
MRNLCLTLLVLLVAIGPATAAPPVGVENSTAKGASGAASEDTPAIVEGNTAFALDLYAQLAQEEGNLFFSPYSISTALAMTFAGARENTEKEMAAVLHFPLGQDRLHPAFEALVRELERKANRKGNELSVANALWGQKGEGFLEEFLELTNKYYGAGLHEVDFVHATEEARQTINAWVEKQTRDKIKDLVPPGAVDDVTVLVLTNAVYFLGRWAVEFDEEKTMDAPFTLLNGEKLDVPMMNRKGDFRYAEDETLQILELPYTGDDVSMLILLPRKIDGLPDLEKLLTDENLQQWTSKLGERKVIVSVPKYKMTCKFELREVLMAMGMVEPFTRKADFSGMNGNKEDLFIDEVLHKAFVDVSEKGTEAAAATAVVMKRAVASAAPTPVFRADHPFVFVIRDRNTGSILFLGRVMNPAG